MTIEAVRETGVDAQRRLCPST